MELIKVKTTELKDIREKLLKKQKYKCLCCKRNLKDDYINFPRRIHVHHSHESGLIIGVLCNRCNQAEGRLRSWYNRFTRKEIKNNKDWENMLHGLLYLETVKPTKWIHPTHGRKKRKTKTKTKCKK